MKRYNALLSFISTFAIITMFLLPFSRVYAQSPFEQYEQIFKGGVAGIVNCTERSVRGFVSKMAPELAAFTLDIIKNLATGKVPVSANGLEKLQSRALEAIKEQNIKEACLDSIAAGTAQQLLSQMINDSVNWINKARDGESLFVQNLGVELEKLAIRSLKEYVRSSDVVSATCSSFRDDIIAVINSDLNKKNKGSFFVNTLEPLSPYEKSECDLDKITGSEENSKKFLNGEEFSNYGSWKAYLEVTNQRANQIVISTEIQKAIDEETKYYVEEYRAGNGYLSDIEGDEKSECKEGEDYDETLKKCYNKATGTVVPTRVKTPGNQVKKIAEQVIENDFYRVTLVDELSDLYAIAGDRLITKIFDKSRQGLLGLDPYGNPKDKVNTKNDGSLFEEYDSQALQGGGIFSGSNPADALHNTISDRLEEEKATLAELKSLREQINTPEAEAVRQTVNQCSIFGSDPNLQFSSQTFLDIPVKVATGDYLAEQSFQDIEVGPQKIDWAGNVFEWKEGERYGLQSCGEESYPGENDRAHYKAEPKFSYYVARFYKDGKQYSFNNSNSLLSTKHIKTPVQFAQSSLPPQSISEAEYTPLLRNIYAQSFDSNSNIDEIILEDSMFDGDPNSDLPIPPDQPTDENGGKNNYDDFEYRWVIHACVNTDDKGLFQGSKERWVPVQFHNPSAFRDPLSQSVEKIDWEGNPLKWSLLDRYENNNRYLFNFCDETNKGRASYHVGNYQRTSIDKTIQFILEPGSEKKWYRSTCSPYKYTNADFTCSGAKCGNTATYKDIMKSDLSNNFSWLTHHNIFSFIDKSRLSVSLMDTSSDHSKDVWVNTTYVGPAFIEKQTLSGNTLDSRIIATESLITELEELLNRIYTDAPGLKPETPTGSTQISIGELEKRTREFNALRENYAFSEQSESDMIRSLQNDYKELLYTLQSTIEESCS